MKNLDFSLEAADTLVNVNSGTGFLARVKRWAVGEYSHVFKYMGKWDGTPMLFESNGRGVVLQSLSNRYGQEVVVMRLKPEHREKIPAILNEAKRLASDPQAYYDYTAIILHIIPRILFEKLRLPIPLKYQRDEKMICSEAEAETYWRSGLEAVSQKEEPLPGDFTESPLLEKAWQGTLSEACLPEGS